MSRFVRYHQVFRLYEKIQPYLKYSLPVEDGLPADNILAIAPHPDDEAIGCGGTLYRHAQKGGQVTIAYCTMDSQERKNESSAAAALIGARETRYLDYPVESLACQKALPSALTALVEELKPDIMFLPFWFDNHEDHRALNAALLTAEKSGMRDVMIYAYPVWFPLYPNVLIDISSVWEKKKEIISCYQSQLATRDYITMSRSLGQYWAEVKGRNLEVVETFFRATLKEYCALGRKL